MTRPLYGWYVTPALALKRLDGPYQTKAECEQHIAERVSLENLIATAQRLQLTPISYYTARYLQVESTPETLHVYAYTEPASATPAAAAAPRKHSPEVRALLDALRSRQTSTILEVATTLGCVKVGKPNRAELLSLIEQHFTDGSG